MAQRTCIQNKAVSLLTTLNQESGRKKTAVPHSVVYHKQEAQHRSQYITVLILGTPRTAPLSLEMMARLSCLSSRKRVKHWGGARPKTSSLGRCKWGRCSHRIPALNPGSCKNLDARRLIRTQISGQESIVLGHSTQPTGSGEVL